MRLKLTIIVPIIGKRHIVREHKQELIHRSQTLPFPNIANTSMNSNATSITEQILSFLHVLIKNIQRRKTDIKASSRYVIDPTIAHPHPPFYLVILVFLKQPIIKLHPKTRPKDLPLKDCSLTQPETIWQNTNSLLVTFGIDHKQVSAR